MQREIRSMVIGINKVKYDTIFAPCSCPAGESGYCNYIMALLFEIADYILHQLISIPEGKVCTSMARGWSLPSANSSAQPITDTAIWKNPNLKKGITCTLYNQQVSGTDPDIGFKNRLEVLKQHLTSKSNLTLLQQILLKETVLYTMRHITATSRLVQPYQTTYVSLMKLLTYWLTLNQQMTHPSSVTVKYYFLKSQHTILIKIFGVKFILETVMRKFFSILEKIQETTVIAPYSLS